MDDDATVDREVAVDREGVAEHRSVRLKPGMCVLLRDANTVQIGLDQALVLPGVTRAERDFLASLEDSRAPISAAMHQTFPDLIGELERHGVLEGLGVLDQSSAPDQGVAPGGPARAHLAGVVVRIHGLGAIGASMAITLARAGVGGLALVDTTPAGLEPPGTYGLGAPLGTCAGATAWMLRERALPVRLAAAFEAANVEVVIGQGAIPAHLAAALTYRGVPHLPVIANEHGVAVGPVIRPGRTACTRCVEIARTRLDPLWPRLAKQCALSRRPRLGPLASEAAAALAASAVMGVLTRHEDSREGAAGPAGAKGAGAPEGAAGAARAVGTEGAAGAEHGWWVDAVTGAPSPLPHVDPEPECGCGAAGSIGDEVAARRAAMRAL